MNKNKITIQIIIIICSVLFSSSCKSLKNNFSDENEFLIYYLTLGKNKNKEIMVKYFEDNPDLSEKKVNGKVDKLCNVMQDFPIPDTSIIDGSKYCDVLDDCDISMRIEYYNENDKVDVYLSFSIHKTSNNKFWIKNVYILDFRELPPMPKIGLQ